MNNFFKGILIFFTLFLLWKCAETTPPVLPNEAQVKRLLSGEDTKKWKKWTLESLGNSTDTCLKGYEMAFLSDRDSILTSSKNLNCNLTRDSTEGKFKVKAKNNMLYLQKYNYYILPNRKDSIPDTLERKIIFITNNELTTEIFEKDLQINLIEKFKAL